MKECIYRDDALDLTDQLWQEAYNAGYYDSALRLGVLYRKLEDLPTADLQTKTRDYFKRCGMTDEELDRLTEILEGNAA